MQLTILDNITIKESSDLYFAKTKKGDRLSRLNYIKVVVDFMQFIVKLIFEGHLVELPCRTGRMWIKCREQNIERLARIDTNNKSKYKLCSLLAVDWKATRELWQKNPIAKEKNTMFFHLNEHTQHRIYWLHWDTKNTKLTHAILYKFNLSRQNRRDLGQLIKQGKEY